MTIIAGKLEFLLNVAVWHATTTGLEISENRLAERQVPYGETNLRGHGSAQMCCTSSLEA